MQRQSKAKQAKEAEKTQVSHKTLNLLKSPDFEEEAPAEEGNEDLAIFFESWAKYQRKQKKI